MFRPGSSTYLIAGLGNPGREYRNNRHNVGFMMVNRFADELQLEFRRRQFNALVTKGRMDQAKVILAKPQAYMNLSGRSISTLKRYYRVSPLHLLIIYDDLDIPLGTTRFRPSGGSGGHRGMKSIIQHLGTQDFPRLRIGIGRPPGKRDPSNHVLSDFTKDEQALLDLTLQRGVDCIHHFLKEDIQRVMDSCNLHEE